MSRTSCLKEESYLKCKWQQTSSDPQPISTETNTQPLRLTGQMIELCCEYLSERCIWLYVIIVSCTSFRANRHSIVSLNVKELICWSRRYIWGLSGRNEIRTQNHLVRKQALNHLTKLAKWLNCVVSTFRYGAFDCMFLSYDVRVSDRIHTL